MAVQYTYSGQLRRFVTQFIRMTSNFQVEFGKDDAGNKTLMTVPVYYGNPSRQASAILKQNSENTMNAVPAMAAYIYQLSYDRDRIQNPFFEGSMRIRERTFDQISGTYTDGNDGLYSVDRLMPAPYKLTMKLDIWSSNTEQKHQIIEQMLPLFNPGLEIQNTDNYLDWSSLSVVLLDDVSYSNRVVPMGGDEAIDICTLTFQLPIWLSLPAKVKKMGVVAEIIASIYEGDDMHPDFINSIDTLVSQQQFTPMNAQLVLVGNTLTLLNSGGVAMPWVNLINLYGSLQNGISQVRLNFTHVDGTHQIVGTVAYNPLDNTQLLYTIDPTTLPANTILPINAIIDPQNVLSDSFLNPVIGTRYLILNGIAAGTEAWGALNAAANSIIEWDGISWQEVFVPSGIAYVSNLKTGIQYMYNEGWMKSYEGLYSGGDFSLVL